MNLWHIFPESLLHINGILQLPYLALVFYIYVFYSMVKNSEQRIALLIFVLLSILASSIMVISFGPQVGKIIPPLALLSVMLMPLIMLMVKLKNKTYSEARLWLIMSLTGFLHSISWSVWLFALAGS
jgi:hypothetical protein